MIDKKKITDSIRRMPADASFDDALYRLRVLQKIELGLKDIEAGRVYDSDEVFDELLNEQLPNRVPLRRQAGQNLDFYP
jgi:predicted transcriptional regulator